MRGNIESGDIRWNLDKGNIGGDLDRGNIAGDLDLSRGILGETWQKERYMGNLARGNDWETYKWNYLWNH